MPDPKKGKNLITEPGHVTDGDIFDDLGFSPEEAVEAKIKAEVWQALMCHIGEHGLTQAQLAKALRAHQPDVSNLMMGKISRFSITKLIQFAVRLNLRAEIKVRPCVERTSPNTRRASTAKRTPARETTRMA